ncbi:DUF2147 domain-containing protein [Sphingomonas sp. M1-B02]|uniref:DUF2147 domain-containing protein n=1 Tax=Sphingomonas sp. M1-B02 TaxID=3114300 RepID=UPI0022407369|nr:DUF2147 domain-containing protein [Sphingomonas sp. S6-11]UZK66292.1 DUF2147 domain-containing protein [Sphingomonas sp. S6-11]
MAIVPLPGIAAPTNPVTGLWINPRRSVAVEILPCANKVCGRVIWASRDAAEDARKHGVDRLIGTELLENYSLQSDGSWAGRVFVPDRGARFASTMTAIGSNTLRIKGCMLGRLLCKAQIWQRISEAPGT